MNEVATVGEAACLLPANNPFDFEVVYESQAGDQSYPTEVVVLLEELHFPVNGTLLTDKHTISVL